MRGPPSTQMPRDAPYGGRRLPPRARSLLRDGLPCCRMLCRHVRRVACCVLSCWLRCVPAVYGVRCATATTGCAALACAVIVAALASCICLFCPACALLLSLPACYLLAPAICLRSPACYSLRCIHCQLCQLLTSLLLTQSLRYTVHVHSLSGYRLPVRSAPCSPCRAPASRWLRCYAVYHIRCFHLLIDS